MANGNPFTTIDLPPIWPEGTGEVTQANGVLTPAGQEWVDHIIENEYKNKFNVFVNPTISSDGMQITFTNAETETDEKGSGVWFRGEDALKNAVADALAAGYPIWEIEILTRAGEVSWQSKGDRRPADQTWTIYEADNGDIYMYDKRQALALFSQSLSPKLRLSRLPALA